MGEYVIIYRIEPEEILILHVIRSSRDIAGPMNSSSYRMGLRKQRLMFAPPLRLDFEEFRGRHDLATLILLDLEQVVIPGHEVIRTASGRTFKDSVIRGVVYDDIDSLLRFDVLGKRRDLANGGINAILRPTELRPEENALHFVKDVV